MNSLQLIKNRTYNPNSQIYLIRQCLNADVFQETTLTGKSSIEMQFQAVTSFSKANIQLRGVPKLGSAICVLNYSQRNRLFSCPLLKPYISLLKQVQHFYAWLSKPIQCRLSQYFPPGDQSFVQTFSPNFWIFSSSSMCLVKQGSQTAAQQSRWGQMKDTYTAAVVEWWVVSIRHRYL